jgi:hypothetical protein
VISSDSSNSSGELSGGFDLADYLIWEQIILLRKNYYIDKVNKALEIVKSDANLFKQLNDVLDGQIAYLMSENNYTKADAEKEILTEKHIGRMALVIAKKAKAT